MNEIRKISENSARVPIVNLKAMSESILVKSGHPPEDAKIMSAIMMYSQMRGGDQGFVKLTGPGMPRNPEAVPMHKVWETSTSKRIDGGQNPGMVVMYEATQDAIDKARDNGVGIVGTFNTSSSTGAIGYYARRIAEEGYIGMAFSGAYPLVAPEGVTEPILAPNAISIAVPNGEVPMVYDMTTAAMPFFGVVTAKMEGRNIPDGIAYDKDGHSTIDPAAVIAGGAIKTFAGHKGSGLSIMAEIITGAFVGAQTGGIGEKSNWGNTVFAFDPQKLMGIDPDSFSQIVSQFAERIHRANKVQGIENVFVPGERGDQHAIEAEKAGSIEISQAMYDQLKKATGWS
jgi:LDH2 family malate/lactate/ureidoglycolate dehydrogenase